MRAVIFIGSLKKDASQSHTTKLARRMKAELETYGVEVTLRYLRNRRMAHGVEFDTGERFDEAEIYYEDVNRSDIVIMATPIWWGVHSSLTQQLMERLGAYDDQYIVSGKSPLYNKVFGSIITASNDGFQHIQGILYAFASNLGMTVPPEAHVTWGTVVGAEKNPMDNPETENQVKNAARNLYLWAKTISAVKLGDVALSIKPGRVGLLSNDEEASSD
jgi:multimeric flavodoxin WrbA